MVSAVTDYNGNVYDSIAAMCREYKVAPALYLKRMERGWSQKEALTGGRIKEPTKTFVQFKKEAYDVVTVYLKKGTKQKVLELANARGCSSVNEYIRTLIEKDMGEQEND